MTPTGRARPRLAAEFSRGSTYSGGYDTTIPQALRPRREALARTADSIGLDTVARESARRRTPPPEGR